MQPSLEFSGLCSAEEAPEVCLSVCESGVWRLKGKPGQSVACDIPPLPASSEISLQGVPCRWQKRMTPGSAFPPPFLCHTARAGAALW